jgi:hypothetical protein
LSKQSLYKNIKKPTSVGIFVLVIKTPASVGNLENYERNFWD